VPQIDSSPTQRSAPETDRRHAETGDAERALAQCLVLAGRDEAVHVLARELARRRQNLVAIGRRAVRRKEELAAGAFPDAVRVSDVGKTRNECKTMTQRK
jgi:hypothetical protein